MVTFLVSLIFTSCEKNEEPAYLDIGNYSGTFQREWVWGDSDTANIIMTFSSNTWSGTSDKIKYPALCNGTYRIEGDTIVFENLCVWTAEFDASLILSGKYKLISNGNNIEINKDYRSATADTYIDRFKLIKELK
jgi:hypothetical protein